MAGKKTSTDVRSAETGQRRDAKVLIIEDQRLIAEFLNHHCRALGLIVVAASATLAAGMAEVRALHPDLLLLDFSLPDGDGLEAAQSLMKELPRLRIIGISSHCDAWTMLQVQRIGLHGFVDKHQPSLEELTRAIDAVLSGRTYYTPMVNEATSSLRRDPAAFFRVLSDYEMQILALIGQSKTDDEIGLELGVSPATVQSRRRDILKKLNLHSTPKLIHFAIKNGLTRPDQITRLSPAAKPAGP